MRASRTVFLIDDDDAVCHALSVFLEAAGYRVRSFSSAEAFLEAADSTLEGVMVLELQTELNRRGAVPSIIFISGHGDVQMSVKAIKAGATNFLEKPFNNDELLTSIREAFSQADKSKKQRDLTSEIRKCHASLTDREKEVLQHVVAGMSNRHLAELLGVSDRTVEVHRSRGMKKMGAESLPDLVRKYALCQKTG